MKKLLLLVSLAALVLLAACADPGETPTANGDNNTDITATKSTEVIDLSENMELNSVITLGKLQLEGEGEGIDTINTVLQTLVDEYQTAIIDQDLLYANGNTELTFTHEYILDFVYADADVVSIMAVGYDYTSGAAHTNNYRFGYVYNRADGSRLNLADLLGEGYAQAIADSIISQIEQAGEADNYFPDYQQALPMLIEQNNWYMINDQMMIVLNPGEISPQALGILEFPYQYQPQG